MAIIGVDPQDIATFDYVNGSGLSHWKIEDHLFLDKHFTVWNFAKPTKT